MIDVTAAPACMTTPISDTTVMASTGVRCDHIYHVITRLPDAMLSAGVSFVGFVMVGIIRNSLIVLPICPVLMFAILFGIRTQQYKKA